MPDVAATKHEDGEAPPHGPAGATYDAFISYSQRGDRAVARALRAAIQTVGKPWWRVRNLNVFLDATSLSAAPGLWDTLTDKLDRTRYLILLASPDAAASAWVDKEVAHFIGPDGAGLSRLLIGLTEGDLSWDAAAGDFAPGNSSRPSRAWRRARSSPAARGAPAHARYPRHIHGWCGRRRTRPCAPR